MTGVVANGIYFNTDSGLNAPGGFLDRLTQAVDNRAQYQGTLAGLGPTLRAQGIPVAQPQGFFDSLFSKLGIGSQIQPALQAPLARATQSSVAGDGASPPTSPSMPTSGSNGAPSSGSGGMMGMFGNAIAGIESGGNYGALGPQTKTGDQALGKYQVMASNVPSWTKEVLGQELTPEQFLASPQAQEAVFNGKFGQMLSQTGNPRDAASMWFTGKPYAQGAGAQDQLGTTGAGYVSKFMAGLPGGGGNAGGPGGMPAQATAYAPSADGSPMMPQASAGGPQPSQGQVMPNTNISAAAGAQGGAGPSASAGSTASPGQVLSTLMANPATRGLGSKLWQGSLQQGGGSLPGQITLPAGMTPEALATMISTPQTMGLGLQIWQKAMFPQITSVEPNRAIFRGTQYVGQSPGAPMSVPQGDAIYDPNTRQMVANNPPKLEHGPIGKDAYGQDVYGSINTRTGTATPFQAQAASGGTATDGNGQPLSGDAFLGSLPPAIAGQVKAIADGRVKLPSGMGATSPMAQRLRAAVLQYDPSFDQAGVDARFETRADFAKGDAAKTITAGNTALIHLGELSSLADKLGNADTSLPGNNVYNAVKNYANSSSAAGAPLAAFNATASKYVEEATKFYRGTGGTESDISRDMLNLSPNMSPSQIKAAIGAQLPLIAGKVAAMQDRWHQGMGPKAGDYPILSPEAQAVVGRLGPQASASTGPASSSLPIASPGGTGQPGTAVALGPLDQARAAIARGAPRGAVIQRLQQMGVSPAGL